jgi:hypothetical protein
MPGVIGEKLCIPAAIMQATRRTHFKMPTGHQQWIDNLF